MIIDIHSHCYKNPVPFVTPFCNPEELIKINKEMGIDKAVLLPVVNSEIYFPQSNDEILEICNAYPDKFIPYCNIDPRSMTNSPNAPLHKVLDYYKNKGCKGIGEVMPNLEITNLKVQNLFRAAEDVELPIVYDGSTVKDGDFGLYDDAGLPGLEQTLQRFPKLKIFGHGPCFWAELFRLQTPAERGYVFNFEGTDQVGVRGTENREEGVLPVLLRRYENLHCDLSDGSPIQALSRNLEYTKKFFIEFQDRLYFGTDMCNKTVKYPHVDFINNLLSSGVITKEIYDKVTHKNAIKLLNL
jgi:predicted TIM-barrel fold metal-dependent hydrolase